MNKVETWDFCAPEYEILAQPVTGPCIVKLLEQVSILPVTTDTVQTIKVIDVAAGPGILSTLLGEAYSQAALLEKVTILSTDFSPNMVELAERCFAFRNWPLSQFSARTLDAMNLVDIPSDHYTHAFCTFGIMMVPNASKALSEMFRVLQPSGTIGITTWEKVGWMPIVTECLARAKMSSNKEENPALPPSVLRNWSDTSYVRKMLEDAGFVNVQVNIFESRWSFVNHDECVKQITEARWITPFLKDANMTDEQRDKYNKVAYEVLLDMVNKKPNEAFDIPMIAIIAHGQKPMN
ncbi:hypothetical protein I4U23_003591 [Adineta vaga]|nr:hypothetical protein I4U23_003591 [Adineta vaga]